MRNTETATNAEIDAMIELLNKSEIDSLGVLAGSTRKTRRPKGFKAARRNPKIWRS
jgi:hypothetical protein